jgi:hypothetical protein
VAKAVGEGPTGVDAWIVGCRQVCPRLVGGTAQDVFDPLPYRHHPCPSWPTASGIRKPVGIVQLYNGGPAWLLGVQQC